MLALPNFYEVHQEDWEQHGMDGLSVVRIAHTPDTGYDFYVNVDNSHLRLYFQNLPPEDIEAAKYQWVFSCVLLTLAMLQDQPASGVSAEGAVVSEGGDRASGVDYASVEMAMRKIAPFILPIVRDLSSITRESP